MKAGKGYRSSQSSPCSGLETQRAAVVARQRLGSSPAPRWVGACCSVFCFVELTIPKKNTFAPCGSGPTKLAGRCRGRLTRSPGPSMPRWCLPRPQPRWRAGSASSQEWACPRPAGRPATAAAPRRTCTDSGEGSGHGGCWALQLEAARRHASAGGGPRTGEACFADRASCAAAAGKPRPLLHVRRANRRCPLLKGALPPSRTSSGGRCSAGRSHSTCSLHTREQGGMGMWSAAKVLPSRRAAPPAPSVPKPCKPSRRWKAPSRGSPYIELSATTFQPPTSWDAQGVALKNCR